MTDAAIVLSGGSSRRMGGATPKPLLRLKGRPLLRRVLDALPPGTPTVIVGGAGEHGDLPDTVTVLAENPPASGPAYALKAGLAGIPAAATHVWVLAADLPLLTPQATTALREAVGDTDGALYADDRPQWLCGCWRVGALTSAARHITPGAPLRTLLGPLRRNELRWSSPGPPPYFDCDTPEALAEAETWL
ncbi:molybdenum cofactor guanylyltransferase [Phytomonospora sp. NPDC050363]|uniref:molybdenum cofactor guanylyltransferase n=1 Tax=Phytomonospora sp. NPDC050363 TaxID=3155642 RepID=UPI0033F5DA02